jgi:hypothetical protein
MNLTVLESRPAGCDLPLPQLFEIGSLLRDDRPADFVEKLDC